MKSPKRHPIFSLLGALTLCYATAFIGTQGTLLGVTTWYLTLDKPRWNPPSWVFAPVWTLLYGLMGVAFWLVWRSGRPSRNVACALFGVQLILNCIWPWLFFAGHLLFVSTLEIFVLWIAIALTMLLFFRQSKLAAALLIPYLLWVSFASGLNFTIWRMNPTGGGVINVDNMSMTQSSLISR